MVKGGRQRRFTSSAHALAAVTAIAIFAGCVTSATSPVSYPPFGPSESGSRSALWKVPRAARQFAWPLWTGMVTSGFGIRRGVMHKGVDIAAPEGTPVHAADAGVVIFVGRLPGYGNTVIIRHSGNYVTIYAHDRENVVRAGQSVSCGEVIGAIGTSGRAAGPHLHFEVRYDNLAYNPLSYLPPPGPSARRDLPAMNPIPRLLTPSVVFGASPRSPE